MRRAGIQRIYLLSDVAIAYIRYAILNLREVAEFPAVTILGTRTI